MSRPRNVSASETAITPAHIVDRVLGIPAVERIVQNPVALVLDPSAGEGDFIAALAAQRLGAIRALGLEKRISGLQNLYAVELQPDSVDRMRSRAIDAVREHDPDLWARGESEVIAWTRSNLLEGNSLTRHVSLLACPPECTAHPNLSLPAHFDLVVGTPPHTPEGLFSDFALASLSLADLAALVLPTYWKLSDGYTPFRRASLPSLISVEDLPWSTFAAQFRASIVVYSSKKKGNTFKLNGSSVTPVTRHRRVANGILAKAYRSWGQSLGQVQIRPEKVKANRYQLYVGWKYSPSKTSSRVNGLQSLSLSPDSRLLPSSYFTFEFRTAEERHAWLSYSSTKLAAYLQSLTDSDVVSRRLPIPPLSTSDPYLYHSDDFLYSQLRLTPEEIEEIESHKLAISGRAARVYEEEGIELRLDATIGKERLPCSSCGSMTFHSKKCRKSPNERTAGPVPEGHQVLLEVPRG